MKKRLLITLLVLVGIVLGPYLIGLAADRLFCGDQLARVPGFIIWLLGVSIAAGVVVIGKIIGTLVLLAIPSLIRWIKTGK